jgi:CubicO group peptidase (beta-lactamase class C family)
VGVAGTVAAGYEPVREALARVSQDQGNGGIAVAAIADGQPVVDLWAGEVGRDSLLHTWSAIKPVVGTCLLLLAARGVVALDDPVARYWPEMRAARNGRMRIHDVLCHAAGLVSVPPPGIASALIDWEGTCDRLAAAVPDWEPGSAVGEHALTYGHLVGELVRRIDGRTVGRFLTDELAVPFGLDLHVGLSDADLPRAADTRGLTPEWWEARRGEPGSLRARALGTGVDGRLVNSAEWRRAEVPAVNGHATARGLASFYALLLAGELPPEVGTVGRSGWDLILGGPTSWTLAGGGIDEAEVGMGGVGGQWACARPADNLAWAFLTTVMGDHDRAETVERALLACHIPDLRSRR